MPRRCGLCVALDAPDLGTAEAWARATAPHARLLKVGLELFSAEGGQAVRRIAAQGPVFLDLKLHDIPNTVAGAVRSIAPLRPAFLTIHAAGGGAMVAAAREAAEKAGGEGRMRILAVTVLTSLDAAPPPAGCRRGRRLPPPRLTAPGAAPAAPARRPPPSPRGPPRRGW